MLRATIKSNCLFFSSKHCVGCFPWQIICWSPNLASAHTGKYCNNSRLTLPCNPKSGIIPANDHVPLPHIGLQTLCHQLLGTVPIAKPGVSLPASLSRSCYVGVACPISACGMGATGAGGPSPSCSLLEVSTAPLMVTLQMFSERVALPILLTAVENKAQRWGLRYWGCVHMDISWAGTEEVSSNWVWIQGSNLCLISPGNRWYACTNNLCCHPLFTINGWFVFLKGKDESRLKIHKEYSKTGRKKTCTFS